MDAAKSPSDSPKTLFAVEVLTHINQTIEVEAASPEEAEHAAIAESRRRALAAYPAADVVLIDPQFVDADPHEGA